MNTDQQNQGGRDYADVERNFWERSKGRFAQESYVALWQSGDYSNVFCKLLDKLIAMADEEYWPQKKLEERLHEAEGIVHDVAGAMKSHWSEDSSDGFWYYPGLSSLRYKPDNLKDVSPVHATSLDSAVSRYLTRETSSANNHFSSDRIPKRSRT